MEELNSASPEEISYSKDSSLGEPSKLDAEDLYVRYITMSRRLDSLDSKLIVTVVFLVLVTVALLYSIYKFWFVRRRCIYCHELMKVHMEARLVNLNIDVSNSFFPVKIFWSCKTGCVYVVRVIDFECDLKPGERIIEVNDVSTASFRHLIEFENSLYSSSTARIRVVCGGKDGEAAITLQELLDFHMRNGPSFVATLQELSPWNKLNAIPKDLHRPTFEKMALITRNLEVLGLETLLEVLKSLKPEHMKQFRIYWATTITERLHIAYFISMMKIADFLNSGCEVVILLANSNPYPDNMKTPCDLVKLRADYYEKIIKTLLRSIRAPLDRLQFKRGFEYQLERDYTSAIRRMSSMVTKHDVKKAGADVVEQVANLLQSGLLYPGLQALDDEYLKVDAHFGGVDHQKIFTFAEKYLPQLGYKKRIYLMDPVVPGLIGARMSSSEEDSKIDLLDSEADVKKKLKSALCELGNRKDNGVLVFCNRVMFQLTQECFGEIGVVIDRKPQNGGPVTFSSYKSLEKEFMERRLHPADLNGAVANFVNRLLEPIRQEFQSPELVELTKQAYPPPPTKAEMAKQKAGQQNVNANGDSKSASSKKNKEKKQPKENLANGEAERSADSVIVQEKRLICTVV